MKKQILLIVFSLIFSIIYAQNNEYFGSVIIKKNEYFVRLASSNLYWTCNKDNTNIQIIETNKEEYKKIMFIPAGKGFYYIKFLKPGNYLTNKVLKKASYLSISKPIKNDTQKFKIIRVSKSKFKFITTNNLAIDFVKKTSSKVGAVKANSLGMQAKNSKLRIWDYKGNKNQIFEIIEAKTNIKLE